MKWTFIAALLAAGCGGTTTAVSQNNQGTGSFTLGVQAVIEGSDQGPTNFTVSVTDGMRNPVSGATVTVANQQMGMLTLNETPFGSGNYVNSFMSLPNGAFTLNVTHGNDKVSNVSVGSVGMSTLKYPTTGATVPANQPLVVSWTNAVEAQGAEIWTRDFNNPPGQGPDIGAYTIPALNNPPNTQQRLTLSRSNSVVVAGGLPGSSFGIVYRNHADPYIAQ